jgi:uncharacterized protein (TIGR00288 family)
VNARSPSETDIEHMSAFSRAPHIEGSNQPAHPTQAPNAALLIDFDNVTMGMRSDLSKELKSLLGSDIIRGKVTVQRAYADWRRYPQYIVPLSEASIDLIFAPAYGSSKKNATDIRMAIDGMELVFTRPEIGTYILLTGDSDFSSLVLKLKEYGKYVIGVGIQESSSDILVQNCDEYYSYTSLSGLRKTSDGGSAEGLDPWVLVERAVEQMVKRSDVMRSDRLKQVMLEIDPGFEEKSFGFSKFSRFLAEAAQKGLLRLRKMENGQYEVMPGGGDGQPRSRDRKEGRRRDEPKRSEGRKRTEPRAAEPPAPAPEKQAAPPARDEKPAPAGEADLGSAYALLRQAIRELLDDQGGDSVRDSDVKRRMLALRSSFDEAELGFGKFSRFLRQAHDHEIVDLRKGENGQYHVALGTKDAPEPGAAPAPGRDAEPRAPSEPTGPEAPEARAPEVRAPRPEAPPAQAPGAETAAADARESRRLRPRLSARRRGMKDEPPPLFEGQVVAAEAPPGDEPSRAPDEAPVTEAPVTGAPATEAPPTPRDERGSAEAPAFDVARGPDEVYDPSELRLPTGRSSVVKYLSNSYRGVGQKTAENLVDALGEDLFRVLQTDPDRVARILTPARAEKVLEGWREDFARRRSRIEGSSPSR